MKFIYLFLILFLPVLTSAQSIQLRGKVIDTDKQPVNNISLRFTSFGDAVTTNSGEFVITVPQTVHFVDVVIRDDKRQLLYPVDAKIPVPADPNYVTTIIVSGNTSGGTSMDESITKYNELENLLMEIGTTNTELRTFLERFIELEAKRLEISEARFREEFERKERRDEVFAEISPFLNEYILRIKNLKDFFGMYYEVAFVSTPAVEQLNNAIRSYNPVFDTINNNHSNWQNVISLAWDDVLSESFTSSINYMIDEIHKPYIFPLNESIKMINEVRLRTDSDTGKLEEKKKAVRDNVLLIMKNLEIKIPILENRFNALLTRLQHAGMN